MSNPSKIPADETSSTFLVVTVWHKKLYTHGTNPNLTPGTLHLKHQRGTNRSDWIMWPWPWCQWSNYMGWMGHGHPAVLGENGLTIIPENGHFADVNWPAIAEHCVTSQATKKRAIPMWSRRKSQVMLDYLFVLFLTFSLICLWILHPQDSQLTIPKNDFCKVAMIF